MSDVTELDDEALLRAHVNGDAHAFGELVRRHRDRLWAVALRTTGDPEDAADAVQEALLSAFRRAQSFRGDAKVTTWLHRIVVNACLDRMRARSLRPTERLPEEDHDAAPRGGRSALGDRSEESSDRRADVMAALRLISDEQRAALVLVDMEGYSVEAAAEILQCAPGTVKSRCSRGRARLAPLLLAYRRNLGPEFGVETSTVGTRAPRDPDLGATDQGKLPVTTDHPSLDAIADYCVGALTDTEAAEALSAHLSECEGCTATAASLDDVCAVLAAVGAEPVSMPLAVQDRIATALQREHGGGSVLSLADRRVARTRTPGSRAKWPLLAAAAAAVTVAGYAGITAGLGPSGSGEQASSAAQGEAAGAAAGAASAGTGGRPADSGSASPPTSTSLGARSGPAGLTPRTLPRYASRVARARADALEFAPAGRCPAASTTKGEVVTTDRWRGSRALVVVRPTVRRVTVFDCRSASVLYSTDY